MLDKTSAIPAYHQLKVQLREQIVSGVLVPGQQLPSERQLAAEHGISKMTVRQALGELVMDGLLERKQGVGTFVAQPRIRWNMVGELVTFFEHAEREGRKAASRVLDVERVPADGIVQSSLKLRKGDPVVCLKRLFTLDGDPVSVSTIHIPEAKCPDLMEDVWHWQSMTRLFQEKYRLFPFKVTQRVYANKADTKVARLLDIRAGSPILLCRWITYLEDGYALEFNESFLRSDRYTFDVTLYRHDHARSRGLAIEAERSPDGHTRDF